MEQDDDVHNGDVDGEGDSVGYGEDGGADNGADGAEKHLVHLAQVADCCWEEISKGGADDGADGAEKHLIHLAHMPTPKSDHILFDEKKALVKLSCVKQTKRVVCKRYFFVAV